jgi:hypothetical protein
MEQAMRSGFYMSPNGEKIYEVVYYTKRVVVVEGFMDQGYPFYWAATDKEMRKTLKGWKRL